MTVHNLQIQYVYAVDILKGLKTFEIRLNDRNFQVGDLICFHVLNVPEEDFYNTILNMESSLYRITYITDFAQQNDNVVMSIRKVDLVVKGNES